MWVEPRITFDDASPADIAALARVFGDETAARILDVDTQKFKRRLAAIRANAADQARASAASSQNLSVSIYDIDAALIRLIQLIQPYLDPSFSVQNSEDARNIIQTGHDLVRAFKTIQKDLHEFIESRQLIRHIISAIESSPDAHNILAALIADDRFKALAR